MEQNELQKERIHLHETINAAQEQLDKAIRSSKESAAALHALQEERMEENQMDMGGMDSAQGFLDILERSQGAMAVSQILGTQRNTEQAIRTLAGMTERPYFARIDFRHDDGRVRQVYIGRATLMDEESMAIHVYDWRVPIASVFYQYGAGPAEYEAPAGTIKGDVLLKRQYEIRKGELVYFFDADEQVLDNFLRDLLSGPSSPTMKGIVETIQRDQDRIIRDMQSGLLMVQGTAGSGKTSVALHRVAYLMYEGLKASRLAPHDILILAPNTAFEEYIAQVLPDLGESQVDTMLFEELLAKLLPGMPIAPRSTWVESLLRAQAGEEKAALRRAYGFKGSPDFVAVLERFIQELAHKWIPFCDVVYDGSCVMTAADAQADICNSTKMAPLGIRLGMLEREIWRRIHALRPARYAKLLALAGETTEHAMEVQAYARMLSIRESGELRAQIRAFTEVSCAALYRSLFADAGAFARLTAGLLPEKEAQALRLQTLDGLAADKTPYQDALAIAYLEARIHGCRAFAHRKQVVVDEVQDLDALHAQLLNLLFPQARFTMLGDINQSLSGGNPSLYAQIEAALHRQSSLLVTLDKSFRCTREIWDFSARFLPPGAAGESFSRSGEKPRIFRAADEAALDALLLERAEACRQAGCQSIAFLCKTQQEAAALHERLKGTGAVHLIGYEGALKPGKIAILSLYMAKGLEFDAVFLYGVDAQHYADDGDKNLLYIGCTRALHRLELFYMGEPSPLLGAQEEG